MKKITEGILEDAGKKGVSKTIDLIVDKFINPKLESFVNRPQDIILLFEIFKEYLNKKYDTVKYMNTIVFQHESKTIDELYIPLTIVQNDKRNKEIILNEEIKNIFFEPKKMLIIDTAGMGKSTLIKFLYNSCIKNGWGFPFIVELRRLEENQSIKDYMTKDVQLINNRITELDINDLIRRGDFIFFLDGYDEILEENKASVTAEIRKLVTQADRNNFILASREDDSLSEFTNFTKYHIKELTKSEAYELIKKYDNYGNISKNLINEIEKDKNYIALKEFLGNPLMVSLLYLTYRYKGVLQYKKNIFYRQVYDALYDRHDITKGIGKIHIKRSGLDIECFRKVLCAMGFISIKYGKVEFEKDEIIKLIDKAITLFPEIKTNSLNYFDDILHAVPLFKEEGTKYKWIHKSFAEYFAAVFICQERKEYEKKILNDILKSSSGQKYFNMLDFCFDIDYKTIVYNLLYPILQGFISGYENAKDGCKSRDLWEIEYFYRYITNVYFVKISDKPMPKDRDIMDDYFSAVDILSANHIRSINYFCYLSKNDNLLMAVSKFSLHDFIKLVYQKDIDIFKDIKVKYYPLKFFKDIHEIGIYDIFKTNEEDSIILQNYTAIISLIYHQSTDFDGKILDINKCKKLVSEIEKDQKLIPDDFFSLS